MLTNSLTMPTPDLSSSSVDPLAPSHNKPPTQLSTPISQTPLLYQTIVAGFLKPFPDGVLFLTVVPLPIRGSSSRRIFLLRSLFLLYLRFWFLYLVFDRLSSHRQALCTIASLVEVGQVATVSRPVHDHSLISRLSCSTAGSAQPDSTAQPWLSPSSYDRIIPAPSQSIWSPTSTTHTMYSQAQSQSSMAPPQKPETFMLSNEAQQSLPQDAQVALQQVDNRMSSVLCTSRLSRVHNDIRTT